MKRFTGNKLLLNMGSIDIVATAAAVAVDVVLFFCSVCSLS